LEDRRSLDNLLDRYPNAVPISARKRRGLAELGQAVSDALSRSFLDVDVETGVGNGRLLAYLAAHGEVLSKNFTDSRMTVHCRIPQQCLGAIHEEGTEVRPHRNGHAW
jgi:GTP-binding protein HflX